MVAAALNEVLRDGQRLLVRDGLDGHTRRNGAQQGQLHRAWTGFARQDLDGAALVVRALDVPFSLEIAEMLVDRRERVIVEVFRNLLEARGITVLLAIPFEIVEN